MAKRKAKQRFTAAEINILKMLWDRGEATLSEAHQAITDRGENVGYTTVQTRLERLVEKGVVKKSATRPATYSAAVEPEDVSGPLLDLLLDRVSGAVPLFAHLIENSSLTADELNEMKRLIAEAERRQKP
ncbi:MAG: BlaI/MecI/CopY family transcriptional regulator [Planctomycetales bacterium]|nr:BlaI/MecI/CopY family transcriptional regulator [Planctomycetales bacterium]MCA9163848.1 BlaI/MecI/CopY family transcriptional regulator [Planctomycetales bacterium]MCA9208004.1 BlaI/MecI/CopY family transcriptional regulator [Planctomycetales bacterium]MCA9227550.1 BlaI/MecI/CopY family transcriptional regulator [Planctomycetales bacterium]